MSNEEQTGSADHVILSADTNGDGKPDVWMKDTTGDGVADIFQFDTDGDGKVDVTFVDKDEDGVSESIIEGDAGHPVQD